MFKKENVLFKFNSDTLEYEPINKIKTVMFNVFCFLLFVLTTGISKKETVIHTDSADFEKTINVIADVEISHKSLKNEISKYNFKFPKIIYAQALLESNSFNSNIFNENNNLFGMKEAKQRLTTSTGTSRNHATYINWQDSVLDRALYEASFLRKLNTQEQYLAYISKNYAEDGSYLVKLKKIINN